MANLYISQAQFGDLFDVRTIKQLSGDINNPNGQPTNMQFILDAQGSRVDAALYGRYDITWAPTGIPPMFLTLLVGTLAIGTLFGRRMNLPKQTASGIENAEKWLEGLMDGTLLVPNFPRLAQPQLVFSDSLEGRGPWDNIFDLPVTPSSTAAQGYTATGINP